MVNFLLGGAEIAESQSLENLSADGDDLIPQKSFEHFHLVSFVFPKIASQNDPKIGQIFFFQP